MVWWWWIIPGVVAVIGLAFALSGLGWMFRGRPFKGGRGALGGGVLLAIGAVVALMGLNIQTYHRLGEAQRQVATISFEKVQGTERTYNVTLTEIIDGAPGPSHTFQATGDDWMISSRVIRWKPWATVLGLDAQYRLDRFDSRYRDIATAQTTPPSVYDLRPTRRTGVDFLPIVRTVGDKVPLVDVPEHGQAVYWPMADGAAYRIDITAQGQLLPDETNEAAAEAVAAWGTTRVEQRAPASAP
ncbi:MAG TPA: hypothetical protein VJ748_06010 [Vitreimonas sp.]|jgi:hypothetical protein|nr:hypothetical protein [Vitreimonas sp.]